MGRIRDAVITGARTVGSIPIPSAVSLPALREARRALPPGGVRKRHGVEVEMIGRTRCVWLDGHRADRGVIVHLHGGAYVSGPFASDWSWLSRQVDAQGCAGLMIDYRTAPDHVHPIGIEDAESAVDALSASGGLSAPWVLSGQHAGGGLAITLARRLRAGGRVPAPSALVLTAPWLDLELSTSGVTETAGPADQVHERRLLRDAARCYAGRIPLEDPDLSPINADTADLAALPPLHLSVGLKDIFLADVRVARLQLEEQGVDLRYREVGGRLGLHLFSRGGEDVNRLHREQSALIAGALSSPR